MNWEIDFREKLTSLDNHEYTYIDVRRFYTLNNGDLFTLIEAIKYDLSPASKIVIVDKDDANIKFSYDVDHHYSTEGLHFHNDGNFSYSEYTQNESQPLKHHIFFLNHNGNYDHVEVASFGGASEKLPISGSLPVFNQASSDIVYLRGSVNDQIIRKYTISSDIPAPNLSGHVSSGFFQDNYVLNWESGLGIQYQIQSSTNLIDWTPVGQRLTGTGYPMTWANHITNSQAFYRVVED